MSKPIYWPLRAASMYCFNLLSLWLVGTPQVSVSMLLLESSVTQGMYYKPEGPASCNSNCDNLSFERSERLIHHTWWDLIHRSQRATIYWMRKLTRSNKPSHHGWILFFYFLDQGGVKKLKCRFHLIVKCNLIGPATWREKNDMERKKNDMERKKKKKKNLIGPSVPGYPWVK